MKIYAAVAILLFYSSLGAPFSFSNAFDKSLKGYTYPPPPPNGLYETPNPLTCPPCHCSSIPPTETTPKTTTKGTPPTPMTPETTTKSTPSTPTTPKTTKGTPPTPTTPETTTKDTQPTPTTPETTKSTPPTPTTPKTTTSGTTPMNGEKPPLMPYAFNWAMNDIANGNRFKRFEISEGYNVQGNYSYVLPDGRTQTVRFISTPDTGYRANVTIH